MDKCPFVRRWVVRRSAPKSTHMFHVSVVILILLLRPTIPHMWFLSRTNEPACMIVRLYRPDRTSLFIRITHNALSALTITAAECPALTVGNGTSSSTSASKTTETVEVTCDDGYNKVGTGSTTCSPDGPGKSAWTNVPS